jgi:energy-coupling factor transporter transmembrane protein EcfT
VIDTESTWHRASTRWSGLALLFLVLSLLAVGTWSTRSSTVEWQPGGVTVIVAALFSLIAAGVARNRRRTYRALLLIAVLSLVGLTALGGLSVGVWFLPATVCVLLATGTESLERRAAQRTLELSKDGY